MWVLQESTGYFLDKRKRRVLMDSDYGRVC